MPVLKEIFKISKGKKEEETEVESKLSRRYIQIEDLRHNDNPKYCIPNKKSVYVNKNDLIIAWDGANAGTIGVGLEGVIGSTLARLELKNNKVIPYYAARFLQSKFQYLRDNCTGATIPHISKTVLENLSIPLSSLETQKKIVEVLDKAQVLIDTRKEQIKLMDELIQSVFNEMFGDPVTNQKKVNQLPLGELCNLKAGKFIKASQISDSYEEKLYPCYGGNGLRGYVEEYSHAGSYPLIGRQGALCGNVQFAEGKFYATEHAIVAQPKANLNITWLYIMLSEMDLNRLATGAAQPGLNVSTLMPLEVIYPEISLQTEFAKKFKEIEIQKAFMKKSLIDIENNYYGLLQKAFSGKLF